MDPVERIHARVRDRLPPAEQPLADGFAIEPEQERTPDPRVAEDRVVEVGGQVLVDEPRPVLDHETVAVALLERERLVDREPQLARDEVDRPGEEVRLQGHRVLDGPDDDEVEVRLAPPPLGVALEPDVRSARDLRDPVGAVVEAGMAGLGLVAGSVAIGRGVLLEDGPLEVLGQEAERADGRVVVVEPVVVDGVAVVVVDVDGEHPEVVRMGGNPGPRVAPDLPGEDDVAGGDGGAVPPFRARIEGIAHRHPLPPARQRLDRGRARLDRRHAGAQHAGVGPVVAADHRRPAHEAEDVALGEHRVDDGMKGGGELGDADDELARVVRLGGRGGPGPGGEREGGGEEGGKGGEHGTSHEPGSPGGEPVV